MIIMISVKQTGGGSEAKRVQALACGSGGRVQRWYQPLKALLQRQANGDAETSRERNTRPAEKGNSQTTWP